MWWAGDTPAPHCCFITTFVGRLVRCDVTDTHTAVLFTHARTRTHNQTAEDGRQGERTTNDKFLTLSNQQSRALRPQRQKFRLFSITWVINSSFMYARKMNIRLSHTKIKINRKLMLVCVPTLSCIHTGVELWALMWSECGARVHRCLSSSSSSSVFLRVPFAKPSSFFFFLALCPERRLTKQGCMSEMYTTLGIDNCHCHKKKVCRPGSS